MSTDPRADANRLQQTERRGWFERQCGREPWFTAWAHVYDEERMGWLSCYLVPAAAAEDQLRAPEFGRVPHSYEPAFAERDGELRYERYGNAEGYEPLIHRRSWHGLRPTETEVSEEYRHFHNLFRANDGSLARVTGDGAADEVVVRFTSDSAAEFLLQPLLQYLAARQLALAACVDWREFASVSLDALGIERWHETFKGDGWTYSLGFGELSLKGAFSRLLGKKVIEPPPVERSGVWPYEEEQAEVFPDLIIGIDEEGELFSYSCEPDALGSYFDRDPDPSVPHYLTPVHFRREVLARYYDSPDRYRIEDGMLSCGGLWYLQIDNDHPNHVVVYLGDIGRDLPEAERPHWRLHNVPPDDLPESETSYRRNRLALPTDPTSPDLVLPHRIRELNARWERRYGWPLFRPLANEDAHDALRLRVPLSDSDTAFDEQVRILAKLTIESIHPSIKDLAPPPPEGERRGSILTLAAALNALGGDETAVNDDVTRLLGALNALNNGVRHGKGEDWKRATAEFGLPGRPRPAAFRDILEQLLVALNLIASLA